MTTPTANTIPQSNSLPRLMSNCLIVVGNRSSLATDKVLNLRLTHHATSSAHDAERLSTPTRPTLHAKRSHIATMPTNDAKKPRTVRGRRVRVSRHSIFYCLTLSLSGRFAPLRLLLALFLSHDSLCSVTLTEFMEIIAPVFHCLDRCARSCLCW